MERGVRFLESIMSEIELRQRVREQQAEQKKIVLRYRGVAYIVKRNVASKWQTESLYHQAHAWNGG